MSEDRIITIQQLTLVLGPTHAKRGRSFSNSSAISNCEPAISIASVPRQRWVSNRGKQTAAPSFLEKRDRRDGALTVHADCPLKDIACVLFRPNNRPTIVCVIGCQITRTRSTHNLKRLASARHDK